jgi:ABC-type Mn2+/Zn2+ transport system permease subunit
MTMTAELLSTIAVGCVVNLTCALVGVYLVLRRQSLLGDAISHSVLPGLVLAFLLTGARGGWPVLLGALVMGILTAVLAQGLQRIGGSNEDASLGVVFTALFAVGVILINRYARQVDLDPGCVLYGLIEFTPLDTIPLAGWAVPRTLLTLVPMFVITVAFIAVFWKELQISSFDPALATALGLRAGGVGYLLLALVAAVTVVAFEAVGSILVVAMLIVPAATAQLLADRLGRVLAWAALVALASAILGTLWATWLNTSVAGMMAVVAGLLFATAVVLAPQHGLLSRLGRNLALRVRITAEDVLTTLYRAEEAQRPPAAWPARSALARWWLTRRGWIAAGQLTDAGRRRAVALVRAHRLWETYLAEHFDLPADHLHEPAEFMEHYLDEPLRSALDSGKFTLDPHGKPIPPKEEI